jgi:hypothetical protein
VLFFFQLEIGAVGGEVFAFAFAGGSWLLLIDARYYNSTAGEKFITWK